MLSEGKVELIKETNKPVSLLRMNYDVRGSNRVASSRASSTDRALMIAIYLFGGIRRFPQPAIPSIPHQSTQSSLVDELRAIKMYYYLFDSATTMSQVSNVTEYLLNI